MYWLIYLFSSLMFCYLITKSINAYRFPSFCLIIVLLSTPTNILEGTNLMPSFLTYAFNVILEDNLSTRPLRPLMITLPITLTLLMISSLLKKRFFQ